MADSELLYCRVIQNGRYYKDSTNTCFSYDTLVFQRIRSVHTYTSPFVVQQLKYCRNMNFRCLH
jgi:hypothetical protein